MKYIPDCECWIFDKELDCYKTIVPAFVRSTHMEYEEFNALWFQEMPKCPYCQKPAKKEK